MIQNNICPVCRDQVKWACSDSKYFVGKCELCETTIMINVSRLKKLLESGVLQLRPQCVGKVRGVEHQRMRPD